MWEGGVGAGEDAAELLSLRENLQVQGGSGVPPEIRARSSELYCTFFRPTGPHWIRCLHLHPSASSSDAQTPQKSEEDEALKAQREANPERTASGRVQRASAQVANFHLAEIANNELPKDWPKRKFQSDLVPDDKKARENSVCSCCV